VVLGNVSGRVANFAGFTLMLVFAPREQLKPRACLRQRASRFPTAKTNLRVLGEARSNHTRSRTAVRRGARAPRSWWLNPVHPRSWNTGDSARTGVRRVHRDGGVPQPTQLGEFVHDLA